jgi:hypothetical protein
LRDQPDLPHDLRQARLGLADPVLCLDLGDVEVGPQLEGDRDGEVAVRCRRRVGIDRILDAVDLLLERRDDGFRNRLRRGARIGAADDDGGRHDLRVLADRQQWHCHETGRQDEDGNNRCKDRAVDEER